MGANWDWATIAIEAIGWTSTAAFLFSIVVPNRLRLHQLGVFTSVTTAVYAYHHGATAIWVKWCIAFFFHGYMCVKPSLRPPRVRTPGSLATTNCCKA